MDWVKCISCLLVCTKMYHFTGGEYDSDRKMDDLKLLYRVYITDSSSCGHMEEHKVDQLSYLFC